jgi:transposase
MKNRRRLPKMMSAQRTLTNPRPKSLYLAFELSQSKWKLGFSTGLGQAVRIRNIAGGDLDRLGQEIEMARVKLGICEQGPIISCYEAGRDGFWLHRYLCFQGIENWIVDSASIEVNRRGRRTKTDRLDAGKLLSMLIRFALGEREVWRTVNVPTVSVEDWRHLHRELKTLKKERTGHINRIKGLLAGHGIRMKVKKDFLQQLTAIRKWDGATIPTNLQARMVREYERMELVNRQIQRIEDQRQGLLESSDLENIDQVRDLMKLRGIGIQSAWLFVMEFFSWRDFQNGKEVGALAGLTSTPYQSGGADREQGISKAGNRYVRGIVIETAWSWLRYQPESELSLWYQRRFGSQSKRMRRVGIVALARRLLVSLWRYLETGELPKGAVLKSA